MIARGGARIAAALAFGLSAASAAAPDAAPIAAAADHHLHIQGAEVTAMLNAAAAATPERFRRLNPDILKTRTGDDALAALDAAGIARGVLLSEAYMFASRFSALPPAEVARLTRIENARTVAAALASRGRLLAFIGVNPLHESSVAEMRYWACRPGVTGVKAQLGNTGFDPRSPDHRARLARMFDIARESGMAIAVHVRSANDYPVADVDAFIGTVLPHAGSTPVQIAHGGGQGRLDEATVAALARYADAIARKAPGTGKLVFDLAVIVDADTDPHLAARYARTMRAIGIERFVFGSDWPSLHSPREYGRLLQAGLPLDRAEWRRLLGNHAPYFDARKTAGACAGKGPADR